MAETAIQVFSDLTNLKLVKSAKGGLFALPNPYHQDKLYLSIQPLTINPTGNDSSPYQVEVGSGYSLSVLIAKASDSSTLVGPVTSWTPSGNALLGTITLFTTEMNTAFGAGVTSVAATIEFQFGGASGKWTIQQALTIKRALNVAGVPASNPSVRYLTDSDESRFVKYTNNPDGASITLRNEAGTNSIVIRVNSDGSFAADSQ